MQRFYYSETFQKFLSQSGEAILGHMDSLNEYDLTIEQRVAWVDEIPIMREVVRALPGEGQILFEYTIPRLGKRLDVVLLYKGIVFAIEFKTETKNKFLVNDKEQVMLGEKQEYEPLCRDCFQKALLDDKRNAQSRNLFEK